VFLNAILICIIDHSSSSSSAAAAAAAPRDPRRRSAPSLEHAANPKKKLHVANLGKAGPDVSKNKISSRPAAIKIEPLVDESARERHHVEIGIGLNSDERKRNDAEEGHIREWGGGAPVRSRRASPKCPPRS